MRSFFSRMNSTLRGFLIILAIVAVIVILQLQATLVALLLIARIVFIKCLRGHSTTAICFNPPVYSA